MPPHAPSFVLWQSLVLCTAIVATSSVCAFAQPSRLSQRLSAPFALAGQTLVAEKESPTRAVLEEWLPPRGGGGKESSSSQPRPRRRFFRRLRRLGRQPPPPPPEKEEPQAFETAAAVAPSASALSAVGASYSKALASFPILTKSLTACIIFSISDLLAQRFEGTTTPNLSRTLGSAMVGFFFFGPMSHVWFENIFRLFPGTGVASTLKKAAMGQVFFGPSIIAIFFGASLWQSGQLTWTAWIRKLRQDLPGAWVAGLGFWPLVDLAGYSMISPTYMPLYINLASLVWTIYVSLVANRQPALRTE